MEETKGRVSVATISSTNWKEIRERYRILKDTKKINHEDIYLAGLRHYEMEKK